MNPLWWLKRALLEDGPDRAPPPDEIVVLAEAASETEAELWADTLRRNGVPCRAVYARSEMAFGARPHVLLKHGDVPRARVLLGFDQPMVDPTAQ